MGRVSSHAKPLFLFDPYVTLYPTPRGEKKNMKAWVILSCLVVCYVSGSKLGSLVVVLALYLARLLLVFHFVPTTSWYSKFFLSFLHTFFHILVMHICTTQLQFMHGIFRFVIQGVSLVLVWQSNMVTHWNKDLCACILTLDSHWESIVTTVEN